MEILGQKLCRKNFESKAQPQPVAQSLVTDISAGSIADCSIQFKPTVLQSPADTIRVSQQSARSFNMVITRTVKGDEHSSSTIVHQHTFLPFARHLTAATRLNVIYHDDTCYLLFTNEVNGADKTRVWSGLEKKSIGLT